MSTTPAEAQNGAHTATSGGADESQASKATTSYPLATSSSPPPTDPAPSTSSYPVARSSSLSNDSLSSLTSPTPPPPASSPAPVPPVTPAAGSAAASESSSAVSSRVLGVPDGLKVVVHCRAVGDAPILKKSKFMLNASYRFIVLIDFLRKQLHYKATDTLVSSSSSSSSSTPAHSCDDSDACTVHLPPHCLTPDVALSCFCCLVCARCGGTVRVWLCTLRVRQFVFCSASFSPSPDALIFDLWSCFQLNNELVIHYATQDAWG